MDRPSLYVALLGAPSDYTCGYLLMHFLAKREWPPVWLTPTVECLPRCAETMIQHVVEVPTEPGTFGKRVVGGFEKPLLLSPDNILWIMENTTGRWSQAEVRRPHTDPKLFAFFEDETDAVMFKLRWC